MAIEKMPLLGGESGGLADVQPVSAAAIGEDVELGEDSGRRGGDAGQGADQNHPVRRDADGTGPPEKRENFNQQSRAQQAERIVDENDVVVGVEKTNQSCLQVCCIV